MYVCMYVCMYVATGVEIRCAEGKYGVGKQEKGKESMVR